MKKITSAILFCCLIMILSGCGNSEEKASSSTNKEKQANKKGNAKLPSTVFESNKTKETISKSEIHKSIQKYLDTNERVYSFTSTIEEKVWDEKPLTKKEAAQLEKGRALLKKNDQNFSVYIENNKLPEGYQKETNRVSEYFTAYNQTIEQLGNSVQEIEKETKNGSISTKEIKDIMPEKSKLNGRQQAKIEKFLKKINVKTNAFEM
ncbi:NDxxF motif lipoprotein [Mammaliicoccus fleurettii]|uniref:NDxxF motif lipoprotein n=1 Tax=Mammaliicoccus fleurettii TaxID=150056 RepID=UPI000991F1A5|nr:NDxxF motif lipoprotein [Mammaliicoccus fleurettii]OOV76475.1 hypothetical protein B2G86_09630 [Mammaliicoccus fleurettii]